MTQTSSATKSGSAFFCLASFGLCLASLLTNQWYSITFGTVTYDVGAYKVCINGECDRKYYTTLGSLLGVTATDSCAHSPDDLGQRSNAVFGLTIAGGALSLLSCVVTVSSCRSSLSSSCGFMTLAMLASLLGFAVLTAADILFPFVWHKWYFCDTPFCDSKFATNSKCDSFFGYSFAFVVVAAACTLVATVLNVFTGVLMSREKKSNAVPLSITCGNPQNFHGVLSDDRVLTAEGGSATQPHPIDSHEGDASRSPPDDAAPRLMDHVSRADDRSPIAENRRTSEMRVLTNTTNSQSLDGWELDPNTGLYWSDTEKLFYDPVSGHFYDPESELWYDPTTEQWYQGAEQQTPLMKWSFHFFR